MEYIVRLEQLGSLPLAVAARAAPAAIPQPMPASEMPLGETPRRASQVAVCCQIGQRRAAIGRRSVGW